MGLIAPEQGMQILERLLAQDKAQVAVLPINWSRLKQQMGKRRPSFLAELAPAGQLSTTPTPRPQRTWCSNCKRPRPGNGTTCC